MAIYHPSRGGVRGGADQFDWDDVKTDKDRECYLGHTVKASTGRWQKGKDLVWFTRGKSTAGLEENAGDKRKAEIAAIKQQEEEMMAVALGRKPPPKPSSPTQKLSKAEMKMLMKGETGDQNEKEEDSEVVKADKVKGLGFKNQRLAMLGGGGHVEKETSAGTQSTEDFRSGPPAAPGPSRRMDSSFGTEAAGKTKKSKKDKKEKKEKKEKRCKKHKKERKRQLETNGSPGNRHRRDSSDGDGCPPTSKRPDMRVPQDDSGRRHDDRMRQSSPLRNSSRGRDALPAPRQRNHSRSRSPPHKRQQQQRRSRSRSPHQRLAHGHEPGDRERHGRSRRPPSPRRRRGDESRSQRRHSPSPVRRSDLGRDRRRSPSPARRSDLGRDRRRSPSPARRSELGRDRRRSPSPVRRSDLGRDRQQQRQRHDSSSSG